MPRTVKGAKRVLVVDDYQEAREMMAEYLELAGYDVAVARNGHDAIEVARERPPDVVLMDLSLPVMDGWEASRLLKADPRTRHCRIIALTGHALTHSSESARSAGCDAFLRKPVPPQRILEAIDAVLGVAPAAAAAP